MFSSVTWYIIRKYKGKGTHAICFRQKNIILHVESQIQLGVTSQLKFMF